MDSQSRRLRVCVARRPASVSNSHTFTKYDANAKSNPDGDSHAYIDTYFNAYSDSNA